MALTIAKTGDCFIRNKALKFGTYDQISGDTGGSIDTGLVLVEYFNIPGITSWTASGGTVTFVTANPGAAISGSWMAIGH